MTSFIRIFFLLFTSTVFLVACGGSGSSTNTDTGTNSDSVVTDIGVTTPNQQISNLEVVFSQKPESQTDLPYANFSFSAPDAISYECSTDQVAYKACVSPQFLYQIEEGSHQFSVRAKDEVDAVGEPSLHSWTTEDVLNTQNEDLITTDVQPAKSLDASWRGIIRVNCDFSHSSYNDPIVYPGIEGAAHLHRFYGNTLVDHNTTVKSLVSTGESTCQGNELNRSGYWVPALLAPKYNQNNERELDTNGEPAWHAVPAVVGGNEEAHEVFYYSAGIDNLDAIQPVPVGLRMIAGDHMGHLGSGQDTGIVRWHCQSWESSDGTNPNFSTSIPECSAPDRVRMDIFFPSCWNGVDLDSADHKSHMAYPINTGGPDGTQCPETHPVPIVRPSYHYAFGVKPDVYDPNTLKSTGWRLAADMYTVDSNNPGGKSLHADWFNAWHPTVMQALLDNCIKGGLDCHDGNLANGLRLSGTREGIMNEAEVINKGLGD